MDVKPLQEKLEESLGFTPSLAKPKTGKDVRDEGPAHKMTGLKESG